MGFRQCTFVGIPLTSFKEHENIISHAYYELVAVFTGTPKPVLVKGST